MDAARTKELETQRRAIYIQVVSSMIYTCLPLSVGISTFTLYVALGNDLDVATALTSLALFEILRFPLFILPTVINNIVEARVSLDRVQSFLMEPDKTPVPCDPLTSPGIVFNNATLVYESIKQRLSKPTSELANTPACEMDREVSDAQEAVAEVQPTSIFEILSKGVSFVTWALKSAFVYCWMCFCGKSPLSAPAKSAPNMTDVEFELLVRRAQVQAAEERLVLFEAEHNLKNPVQELAVVGRKKSSRNARRLKAMQEVEESDSYLLDEEKNADKEKGFIEMVSQQNPLQSDQVVADSDGDNEGKSGAGERVLTLFRVSMQARRGSLLCIVGRVGSGKSSVLMSLLGDMICVLGNVAIKGKVAYVGQRPFIQNSTLKDNILFGNQYDEAKYRHTLEVNYYKIKTIPLIRTCCMLYVVDWTLLVGVCTTTRHGGAPCGRSDRDW